MIHSLAEFLSSWLASPARESPTVRLFPAAGWAPGGTRFPPVCPGGGLQGLLGGGSAVPGSEGKELFLARGLGFASSLPAARPARPGRQRDIALRGGRQPRASSRCLRRSSAGSVASLARARPPLRAWQRPWGHAGRVTFPAAVPRARGAEEDKHRCGPSWPRWRSWRRSGPTGAMPPSAAAGQAGSTG